MKMDKELRDYIIDELMTRKGAYILHNREKELNSYREELDKMTDVEIVDELSMVCYSNGLAYANLY